MVTIALDHVGVVLGRRPVVRDVRAVLAPGTLVGIIGPNGAGKSTLLRAILGLVPAAGNVRIDDVPLASMARGAVARTLAYLPQGQTLHWPLTVERLVALGRLPHLAPMSRVGEADAAAVARALERAGVSDLRDRIATELSGGERARVLLARALAVEAPALLADEPLASLDPGHQIDVMELLRAEANGGALVVTVLHDLTMAARYCDRLLLMDAGAIVADGAPLDVLTPERLRAVYGITAAIERHGGTTTIVPVARAY
ncbi:ABC transporter ATP-binding protein [Sphingomonas sp. NFR15]|uniref:ABC transporter ATP-binding protein n=1 Tax=Sphingomonas sp. NFR15 TaxID=1566282 RepID=UPI000883738E|nr:ABC transporter ATP-binding protein [Sphingomonas sp. NFR15]SDA13078.1 iron complex transport system ATP-binding protein [Sphingomonas sp. NFR15]